MNEVTHIHLGRTAFTISADAHQELRDYLAAIKTQVGTDGADVLEEIELRMAELLSERGITGEKVVIAQDIAFLREQLGEPSDFGDDDSRQPTAAAAGETPRRLFRDTDNAMVAGVAAGLARYFGIDAVIIRIVFVALVFASGSGVLIYILLWLLVPEARTVSERLSMQGKAATIDNLKQVVERADVPGAARRGGNAIARVIDVFGHIILLAVGLPLAIGSGLAMLGVVAMGAYSLMDGFKVAGHVVAPIGGHEVIGLIAGLVVLLCILLGMLLVGIAMVRRRWQLPAWGVAALFGIFFLSASVGGALAADVEPGIRHRVEALQHTRTVQLASFRAVTMAGPDINFRYVPDSKMYVRYHYYGSVNADKLHSTVTDGTLVISTNGADPYTCNSFCAGIDPGIAVEVHGPKITTITVNGKTTNLSNVRRPCMVADSDKMSSWCPAPEPRPVPVLYR